MTGEMRFQSYTTRDLENIADQINKKYKPERLDEPMRFDPYALVDALNYSLTFAYLTPDMSKLGMAACGDSLCYVWPSVPYYPGLLPHKELYRAGSIVLDKQFQESGDEQKIRRALFTLVHEITHLLLHSEYYLLPDNEVYSYQQQKMLMSTKGELVETSYYDYLYTITEKQANYVAGAFIAPEQSVKNIYKDWFQEPDSEYPLTFNFYRKERVKKMSNLYRMSYTAMGIRLIQLDILDREFININSISAKH
ncbi:MAG: ImmA/IrrE family metallo-endopeptidase [Clostridia bacterium]|nr:ImmA/IrrE family metallo-endopeptidase [Clostridia bacterium]